MRKTRGVTKYEPRWQLFRASIKGPKFPLKQKLEMAESFFLANSTYDNWERVTNWMEGVRIVYNKAPDSEKFLLCTQFIDRMNRAKTEILPKEPDMSEEEKLEIIRGFTDAELKLLWTDLFKRNEKWSNKGYYHEEHNNFVALLAEVIEERGLFDSFKFKKEDWEQQVQTAQSRPNTHNFFF